MSNEKNKNTAMAERVEAAKNKVIAEREAMKKGAIKITAKLLKGIIYEEDFPIKLVNGDVGLITLRPLAEEEMVQIFEQLGTERIEKMGKSNSLTIEDYEFFWAIVAVSTGLDKNLIKKTFAMGESAVAGQRIMELSGMVESSGTDVERFPEK